MKHYGWLFPFACALIVYAARFAASPLDHWAALVIGTLALGYALARLGHDLGDGAVHVPTPSPLASVFIALASAAYCAWSLLWSHFVPAMVSLFVFSIALNLAIREDLPAQDQQGRDDARGGNTP